MTIPRADLGAQRAAIADELNGAVDRVLSSGRYILGPEVEAFEAEFAAYCGAAHCIATGSGTDALRLATEACGIGPGDEVVTVAHTAPATVFAVELAGATPVLVDIDDDTYTIDPARAADAIGPNTRALMPVHLYGQCADMAPLVRLAEDHGLRLIEDACQAHGAAYDGHRAGSIGHLGCFSFYPTKNLGGYGDGGAVVTSDASLAAQLRLLRDYGRTEDNRHQIVAGNSRLDELQAAILRVKLALLDGWNESRRAHADRYAQSMADLPLKLPVVRDRTGHVFHLYVVRTPERDNLQAYLRANRVGTGVHFPVPVHRQPAYHDRLQRFELPVTEACCDEILSLPIYPELRESEAEHVAELVRRFFGGES
jgi:dTDP-4-amino-4,6-dideoxygalactose transaminase